MDQKECMNLSVFFGELAKPILEDTAYKVTKIVTNNLTIKATRKRFKGRIDKRGRIIEILFTLGRPNYQEREYIKKCKKNKTNPTRELLIKRITNQ